LIFSRELREKLAEVQHAIWSHWMSYLFSVGTRNPDGSFTIPAEKVERWQRQMSTEYNALPDKEQESDRNQADKVLVVLEADINDHIPF
jgi:hypothetical protein